LASASMTAILTGLVAVLSVVVIFLILMHSGKDAGLSGAFGVGTGEGSRGGGSLVERNLNRWTVAVAIVWILSIIALVRFG
ncbi:MAG: preprotein translocase subunit SecG, partial [Solirubrobacterales bacterium]